MPNENPEDVLAARLLDDDEKFREETIDVQTDDEARLLRRERYAAIIRAWLDQG